MITNGAVCFFRADDVWVIDTVRQRFMQTVMLEPHARNREFPAVVLTRHSWVAENDIGGAGPWLVLWAADSESGRHWTVHGVLKSTKDDAEAHVETLRRAGRYAVFCCPPDCAAMAEVAGNGVWVDSQTKAERSLRLAIRRLQ